MYHQASGQITIIVRCTGETVIDWLGTAYQSLRTKEKLGSRCSWFESKKSYPLNHNGFYLEGVAHTFLMYSSKVYTVVGEKQPTGAWCLEGAPVCQPFGTMFHWLFAVKFCVLSILKAIIPLRVTWEFCGTNTLDLKFSSHYILYLNDHLQIQVSQITRLSFFLKPSTGGGPIPGL